LGDAALALRYRDFRLFWGAALVSNTGSWIQAVAIPYVLFRLTGNAAWVGFGSFAQFLPMVLLGPLAGSLADRFSRRRILLWTQAALAVIALTLAAAWSAGARSPALFTALVAGAGVAAGINIPSWQAFVSELVPRSALLNAVTLNSAQFNGARAFGPALGGVVLAELGPGWAFLLNAVSFSVVIGALLLIRRPDEPAPIAPTSADRPGVLRDFGATVRYTRRYPGMWVCVLGVVTVGLLGGPLLQLVVVFADDVFHVGDRAYGFLSASLGVGAILGTPFVAGRGAMRRGRATEVVLLSYGAAIVLFALAPAYWVAVVAMLIAGASYLTFASTFNTTMQLQVDDEMRGRALAFYLMGLTASMPVGALLQGWLVEVVGPRPTVAGAGVLLVAVTLVLRAQRRFDRMDDAGPGGGRAALDDEGSAVVEGVEERAAVGAPAE
jgi:MFS family permease